MTLAEVLADTVDKQATTDPANEQARLDALAALTDGLSPDELSDTDCGFGPGDNLVYDVDLFVDQTLMFAA